MCFSIQSSLIAWILSVVISIYLYNRNRNYDRWNAIFILTFTLIQLLEAGLWFSLMNDKKQLNSTLTQLVLIALLAQPLIQTYMGYTYTHSTILHILSYVYIAIIIYGLYRISTSGNNFSTNVGPNGHLVWNDSTYSNSFLSGSFGIIAILYLFGLFYALFYMKNYKWVPLVAIGLITIYYSWSSTRGKEFSSMWCFTAVLYSIVALFI